MPFHGRSPLLQQSKMMNCSNMNARVANSISNSYPIFQWRIWKLKNFLTKPYGYF